VSLFIPEKIRVGFQNRNDTYSGKLAYVIYYDKKNKLRKEKSWEQWRDDKIEPKEYDNEPQEGFVLNKNIQRYNWSHFGSNRSYIRVFDSVRGIEFEITPENLIGILIETDCSRRGLDGKFVYAWNGTDLVLLPCCSQEYQQAVKFSDLQGKKISARDLVPGCAYVTKQQKEVVYLGRFNWSEWKYGDNRGTNKKHVFYGDGDFFPKGDVSFLAVLKSPDPVSNYAELVDKWNNNIHSSSVVEWESSPLVIDPNMTCDSKIGYTKETEGEVLFYRIYSVYQTDRHWGGYHNSEKVAGFRLVHEGTFDKKKQSYTVHYPDYHGYYRYYKQICGYNETAHTKEQIVEQLKEFVVMHAVLTSGKKIRVREIEDLGKKG